MIWIRHVIAFAFVFLVFPCAATARLEIKLSQTEYMAGKGRGVIVVEAKNVSDRPLYLFGPQTPFALMDGRLYGKWFDVTDSTGSEIRFKGRQVLVRGASPDSYIQLAPGESIRAEVDLGVEYAFQTAGAFRASMSMVFYEDLPKVKPDGESEVVSSQELRTEPVEFFLDPAAYAGDAPLADNVIPCSDEQASQTKKAFYEGARKSSLTNAILETSYYYGPVDPAHPEVPPRLHMIRDPKYVYWFGEWDDDAPQDPDPAAPYDG